jgi:hypothetical protein
VPRRPTPRKADRDLLNALAKVNRELGQMGVQPWCSVDQARDKSDSEVREIVVGSKAHLQAVRKALRGITG